MSLFRPFFAMSLVGFFLVACGEVPGPEVDVESAGAEFQSEAPIIEGEACAPDAYPTAMALLVDATLNFGAFGTQEVRTVVCGGTLIAPDVVLTAAHCVDPTALTMGFGTVSEQAYFVTPEAALVDLADQKTTQFPKSAVQAAQWIVHPEFDLNAFGGEVSGPGDYKDIALVFLSSPMDIEPETVITAAEASQLVEGKDVAIVGWGQQEPTSGPFQQPAPGTVGAKMCAETTITEIGEWEMQIGSTSSRKCHGDSGGPSYMDVLTTTGKVEQRVVGITSHAYDIEDCAKGGVDTRVDVWLDWINATMEAGCQDGTRVWCDVAGIIPPNYFDPPANEEDDGSGSEGGAEDGGCRQSQPGAAWLGFPLFVLWRLLRRRPRDLA